MEILKQLLNTKAMEWLLGFHSRYKGLDLTHLTFADDLLVFIDCSKASYLSICQVFETFYGFSRLKLSYDKIEFFAAGISNNH